MEAHTNPLSFKSVRQGAHRMGYEHAILDSTEKAVEHSLASTSHANVRAMNVFSQSSKTSCFTWLAMLVMLLAFIMVVFLIRIT
ncbi:Nucleoside-triphosphatase THEP1 [Bienertia sinuspersici]